MIPGRWWWISMSREELEKKSMVALLGIASAWYDQMKAGEIPSISLPTRTKYNIEFDDASEVWKYGDRGEHAHRRFSEECHASAEDGVRDRVYQAAADSKTGLRR